MYVSSNRISSRSILRSLALAAVSIICFINAASAAISPTAGFRINQLPYGSGIPTGGVFSTTVAACDGAASYFQAYHSGEAGTSHGLSLGECYYNFANAPRQLLTNFTSVQSCPANSALSGSSCVCSSGYAESGGVCVAGAVLAKQIADALNLVGAPLVGTGGPSLTVCYAGYVIKGTGAASNGSTINEVYGPFTATGATCTDTPAVPVSDPSAKDCPVTSYWGTVNGVAKCVPGVSSISQGETTTATPPAGAASGTATAPLPGAPASASTGSTTTTCTTSTCSQNTVWKDSGGSIVGEKTTTEPAGDYCAKNPGVAICQPFDECVKNPDRLSCQKLGTVDSSGQLGKSTVDIALTSVFFQSQSGCPASASMAFSIMGHSFTPSLSYQPICDFSTTYARPLVLLLGAAAAAFIFVGGLKS